jgi:hypothetical protein
MKNATKKRVKKAVKKPTAPKKGKKTNPKDIIYVPFFPYHIAAIAWIFLPGGSVPTSTAEIAGLDNLINQLNPDATTQGLVRDNLNTVFTALQAFLTRSSENRQAFATGRANFQQLLSSMNNLWDGNASGDTPTLTAKIASILPLS